MVFVTVRENVKRAQDAVFVWFYNFVRCVTKMAEGTISPTKHGFDVVFVTAEKNVQIVSARAKKCSIIEVVVKCNSIKEPVTRNERRADFFFASENFYARSM